MSISLRRIGFELFLASFAALLFELALIRWIATEVRVIAYFPNLVLIAAFLGLGSGALIRVRRPALIAAAMLGVIALAVGLAQIVFTSQDSTEFLWLLYYELPRTAPVVHGVVLPIVAVFAVVTASFIALGSEIAQRIETFRQQRRALHGYAVDLLGSLVGVVGFLLLCAAGTRPLWWFAIAFGAVTFLLPRRTAPLLLHGFFCLLALGVIQRTDRADRYSPYYAINVKDIGPHAFVVLVNGSLHQQASDLRLASGDEFKSLRAGYRIPIANLGKPPTRALVLGAGTGNDVAVLLDAGVPEVHAVEIDPVILDLGRTRHPARPYADPRVIVHNTDARAFLEKTDLKFDLIVFGTLDSMTRLSALTNVRLDNFVYTVDSLRAARARLTPDGGLALMFMSANESIDEHLFGILRKAFDAPPLVADFHYGLFNRVFLAGPGYAHLNEGPQWHWPVYEMAGTHLQAPDDDWPYLYLARRTLPAFYLGIAASVLAIALAVLLGVSRPLRAELLAGRIDWEMIGFGAAFLLLETSFVTEMNLLFGATWRTSAIVFGSLLFSLLLATLVAARRRPNTRVALAGVIVALVLVSFLPLRNIAPADFLPRVVFAMLVCGLPVFCSGLAFAGRFAVRERADTAFGWNIVGAVLGGLLELLSMITGLHALFLLAALLYAAVLWAEIRRRSGTVSAPATGVPVTETAIR
jgi:hypothetical protein